MTKTSVAKSKPKRNPAYTKKPAAQAVGQSTLATKHARKRTKQGQIGPQPAARSLMGEGKNCTPENGKQRYRKRKPAAVCNRCDRPFWGAKASAKFCSSRCRQSAYRKRTKLPSVKHCAHCGDGFRPRNRLHKFCSTNCRTLSHRTLRKQLPGVLVDAFSLPFEQAWDALESSGTSRVRSMVEGLGYSYSYRVRAWEAA